MAIQHKGNAAGIKRRIREIPRRAPGAVTSALVVVPGGMLGRSQLVENIISLVTASMGALIAEPLCNATAAS